MHWKLALYGWFRRYAGPDLAPPRWWITRHGPSLTVQVVSTFARQHLLEAILVQAGGREIPILLAGELAASRVQKGYDMVTQTGERVQVRYLANPKDGWVNEHTVRFDKDVDRYALVVFEDLDLLVVLLFPRKPLPDICAALGKRHPDQERQLQFTQRNYRQVLSERHRFEQLGMSIILF